LERRWAFGRRTAFKHGIAAGWVRSLHPDRLLGCAESRWATKYFFKRTAQGGSRPAIPRVRERPGTGRNVAFVDSFTARYLLLM
jgi:hypothetical protein